MSILSDISKVEDVTFVRTFFILLLVITPGPLFLFHFAPYLFFNLDIFKLVLISISFSAPFILLNFLFFSLLIVPKFLKEIADDKSAHFDSTFAAALFCAPMFYLPFLFAYFFGLSFKITLILMLICQVLILLVNTIAANTNEKK